ncbi:hypothetical protein GCM10011487_16760 [Steroidobacter agaridevorans]|uniref:DUF4239 domain-containing protein n=1 Tax=Steroidobacter agaridevorans TaxID=2695856 RepID=A0A829YAD7_9GAMM|nr:DUF4239 domain-containing protein [Steroidobacter agaridevorans]GFE79676.1 hypothetical protein GCM10011487_16760 [Steroidobacter agaridevorans]GFE90781.1 hypothetical protein GCM10011488_57350 [Steroidobacter agaridevorans]
MLVLQSALFALGLFFGTLICLRAGWVVGRERLRDVDADSGLGAVDGAVFGLMGLLLAFTFTTAAARFDHRRDLVVEEVNAIGTAWLRLELLQSDARDDLRELMRRYVDARIASYAHTSDDAATNQAVQKSYEIQNELWTRLIAALQAETALPLVQSVVPAVNEMFDIAQTRILATRQHPPLAVYLMLGLLVLVSSLLAGFGMAKAASQSKLHVLAFAAIVSASIYLILDIEFPRLGFVRVDQFDRALVELRATMD